MFSYSYKFKLSPKNPNVITLTPTAGTYAKAIAAPYVFLGALGIVWGLAMKFQEKHEPQEVETDTSAE